MNTKTDKEKAKAYDIALDKIKMLLGTGSSCSREELEYVFPEIRESEDERIRKALKQYFINSFQNNGVAAICGVHIKDVLAWLEKQGEQKPADTEKGAKGNDREIPNSAWSEEDEMFVHGLIRGLAAMKNIHGHTAFSSDNIDITKTIDWLKSLKDRVGCEVNCTTTKDWSEEDKRKIDRIYFILRQASDTHAFSTTCRLIGDKECVELQDFLKSIRPQNTWKPSEEQIEILQYLCENSSHPNKKVMPTLKSLYQDLKKLMEE